jgi:DegV family protein with EDD domain
MIRLVTDSTTDLPPGAAEEYGIHIVPQIVVFGDREFRDGVDITADDFYSRLEASDVLPTTTQPSPGDFHRIYERLAEQGADIISIHLPPSLSGTLNSARQASEMVNSVRITPVSTPWLAAAQGFIVLQAARAIRDGADYDEVLQLIDELSPRQNLIFGLDTLEYLHRGGRIGGAQALFGSLLRIKPILHLKDGRVEPLDRVRTWRRVPDRLLELMTDMVGPDSGPLHVGLLHSCNAADASWLEKEILRRFDVVQVFTTQIGPVVGTHAGPGALGIAFYAEK